MNADRNYIKNLLSEMDEMEIKIKELEKKERNVLDEATIAELTKENDELKLINEKRKSEITDLENENEKLEGENSQLHKDIKKIKSNMKKPATITSPNVLNIFEDIKEGGVIKFIKPTRNKNYTNFKDNPFVFQLDNKSAVFCGELVGMFETKNNHVKYFHSHKAPRMLGSEIMYQFLHVNDETFDCALKIGTGKSKKVDSMLFQDVLKLNPCINISMSKFESYGSYKFIYTENDGSKYIITHGKKEYI